MLVLGMPGEHLAESPSLRDTHGRALQSRQCYRGLSHITGARNHFSVILNRRLDKYVC